jgi:hypothetical protein
LKRRATGLLFLSLLAIEPSDDARVAGRKLIPVLLSIFRVR